MANIVIDYKELYQRVAELNELASRLDQVRKNQIENLCSTRQWKGDSGDEFRKKVKKLDALLAKEVKNLRRTAGEMRGAAQSLEWADKTAEKIVSLF